MFDRNSDYILHIAILNGIVSSLSIYLLFKFFTRFFFSIHPTTILPNHAYLNVLMMKSFFYIYSMIAIMLARAHKRLCVQIVNEPTKPTIADHQESEATTTTTKTPTLAETFITPMMINLPVWVYKHQYRYK